MVSGPVAQEKQGIYMISIIGSSLKKLRDDARGASLSPDGSQIAFMDTASHSIWLMDADGSHARPFLAPKDGFRLFTPMWFVNGKRLAYVRAKNDSGQTRILIESSNLQGADPVVLFDNPNGIGFVRGPAGRMILSVAEAPPHQYESNLWEQDYDEETGKPRGTMRRLTDWTGFQFTSLGLTANGKTFVFLNQRMQSAVYIGELGAGGDELKNQQRVTLNENLNWPGGWSNDGKAILFYSDRNGNFDIYRQNVEERSPESIATGPEEKWAPQMSPDGKWVLYMQWPHDRTVSTGKLMRVPVGGGAPEFVMEIQGRPSENGDPASTVGANPNFRCPAKPSADCVLAEVHDKQVVFTAFAPTGGRKAELVRYSGEPDFASWDLSPDGTRVVVTEFSYTDGTIHILPLDKGAPTKLSAAPWMEHTAVAWAADGKSLFLASYSSRGTALVHLGLDGRSKLLFKPVWDIYTVQPSPDGKFLSFGPLITNANAWSIDNFPAN